MNFKLKYGNDFKEFGLDERNYLGTLDIAYTPGLENPAQSIQHALENPIGTPPLKEIVQKKKAKNAVIVLSDITRGVPYKQGHYNSLLILAEELEKAGITKNNITFLVGTGTHRKHTEEESILCYGKEIVSQYSVEFHDADNNIVSIGTTSFGNEIFINKRAYDADLLIFTGMITTHYFAGYSGGRKALLPSIAGRSSIRKNHAMIVRDGVGIGKLKGNPIAEELAEAARLREADFLMNFLVNAKKEIVHIVSGHYEKAFHEGVKKCNELYSVPFKEHADLVIASCGGFPKDSNITQIQKTINNAKELAKPGGTVLIIAKCQEGIGENKAFGNWLSSLKNLENLIQIQEDTIELGQYTAMNTSKLQRKYRIVILSELPQDELEKYNFLWTSSIDSTIKNCKELYGNDFKTYVVPNGGLIYPKLVR